MDSQPSEVLAAFAPDRPAAGAAVGAAAAVTDLYRAHALGLTLTRLPHRQREVLVLRYYLNEPDEAIAELLGIAGSTVRSTLHRALARLGAELPAESRQRRQP